MTAQPGIETAQAHAERAFEHVRYLSENTGPRPSTKHGEWEAAQYALQVWKHAGLNPRLEPFISGSSTYRPYAIAFATGLLGTLLATLRRNRSTTLIAAALNATGAWAFAREAELRPHWARRLAPSGSSQNVVVVVPPRGAVQRRVVLYGHLDTHRTPMFYSSPAWLQAFSSLVGASFAGLVANAVLYLVAGARGNKPHPLPTLIATGLQLFGLSMTLHADTTPYNPGANDNASGAGSVLALGERLAREPLEHTEVWLVANGCEELGAYGIAALLDRHGETLRDADFVSLDMVGMGTPTLLLREGLLLPSYPSPHLLAKARAAVAANPGLIGGEHRGGAYTDTGMVSRRGFRGLTLDTQLPAGHPSEAAMGHWHQMSDTVEHIEVATLARVHAFVWALLAQFDR